MFVGPSIFQSMQALEPRCPKCNCKIEYGISTTFDEKKEVHICNNCGTEL